jgi:hexosaminidase
MNRLIFKLLIVCFLVPGVYCYAQIGKKNDIIPVPVQNKELKGFFNLDKKAFINLPVNNQENLRLARYLSDQLHFLTGLSFEITTSAKDDKGSINLVTGYSSVNKEAYSLNVSKKNVTINGASAQGLFYGIQSFLQLVPPINGDAKIACTKIEDAPLYAWRGLHLDVCRHFYSIEFVKKMIDQMAYLKLNMFHWHLTDDQGWRIEIKKFPKLTEISAFRKETMVGHYTETDQKFDGIRYGGFYTQEQIKEVIRYAADRYITIVPEIEMPGHAVAVLSAYPEFSCTGGPFDVYTKWGVSDDVFCAGKESTFDFLQEVITEVAELFPGPYIHVGGDECPKTRWKTCPLCQKRIKDNNLKDELELQSYFIKRMENFVASKGKKLIGWDEILEGGLPERATVMSWRGIEGGIEAANSGHDVVMTPTDFCYFDHYQGPESTEPLSIGGFLPLENVYKFNPTPDAIAPDKSKHILGGQANLWSEYITSEKQMEYMIFPRLCAMAEVLWSPKSNQNYSDFLTRFGVYSKRLEKSGINYRPITK